jgi:hypothetical protein
MAVQNGHILGQWFPDYLDMNKNLKLLQTWFNNLKLLLLMNLNDINDIHSIKNQDQLDAQSLLKTLIVVLH